MEHTKNVSKRQWLDARLELLAKEKAHSRARDEVTRARMAMPWRKVEKDYLFEGPNGQETLSDLFQGKSQLLLHHFMYEPDWDEGCKSCSFSADHYDRSAVHLRQRDVAVATVSIAPLHKLQAFRKRMGWSFKWVSSAGSDFNRDFHVSFTDEELANKKAYYNYRETTFVSREAPGFSVFARDENGEVYHTYSCFGRGLENSIGAYNYLDLVPRGRDEGALPYGMYWLRLKDQYGNEDYIDPYADKKVKA